MGHRHSSTPEILDVSETSHDQVVQAAKGSAGDLAPDTLLSVVGPDKRRRRSYRPYGSKHLTLAQATTIIEAVDYAKGIGFPLVAHATIHWSGTVAFDDHDGKRFAKVREGFHKYLHRRGIPAA